MEISKACNPFSRNINLSQQAVKTIIANLTTEPEISFCLIFNHKCFLRLADTDSMCNSLVAPKELFNLVSLQMFGISCNYMTSTLELLILLVA